MRENLVRFKQRGWNSRKSNDYSKRHYERDLRRFCAL